MWFQWETRRAPPWDSHIMILWPESQRTIVLRKIGHDKTCSNGLRTSLAPEQPRGPRSVHSFGDHVPVPNPAQALRFSRAKTRPCRPSRRPFSVAPKKTAAGGGIDSLSVFFRFRDLRTMEATPSSKNGPCFEDDRCPHRSRNLRPGFAEGAELFRRMQPEGGGTGMHRDGTR